MPDEPPISQYARGDHIVQAAQGSVANSLHAQGNQNALAAPGGTAIVNIMPTPQDPYRAHFLERLKKYFYTVQLEQALQGTELIMPRLVEKPGAVRHHTGRSFRSPRPTHASLPSGKLLPEGATIVQVYDKVENMWKPILRKQAHHSPSCERLCERIPRYAIW